MATPITQTQPSTVQSRAVVRLRQVGAVILYSLERPGPDATRAHKANGRLIPSR